MAGLAIIIGKGKPGKGSKMPAGIGESEPDESEKPEGESEDGSEKAFAKEAFGALQDGDEDGFVEAFLGAVRTCVEKTKTGGYSDE